MQKTKIKFISLTLLTLSLLIPLLPSQANTSLSDKLSGQILLQVEDKGQAWYLNPEDKKRYYLGRPDDAFRVMRELGLGISNDDFDDFSNNKAPEKLAGKIILKVHDKGKAYYIEPKNRDLHYLGRPNDAFQVMRKLGLGISNENLEEINVRDGFEEREEGGDDEAKDKNCNQCPYDGYRECHANGKEEAMCGDRDDDGCLEWYYMKCSLDTICENGICENFEDTSYYDSTSIYEYYNSTSYQNENKYCVNECTQKGVKNESGKICGNWNHDNCLEYKREMVKRDQYINNKRSFCKDECKEIDQAIQNGDEIKICGYFDDDPCSEWKIFKCSENEVYQPQTHTCVKKSKGYDSAEIATKEDAIGALVNEENIIWKKWQNGQKIITYSFLTQTPEYGLKNLSDTAKKDFQAEWVQIKFQNYKNLFREQFKLYENISQLKFQEVNSNGDIQIYPGPYCKGATGSNNNIIYLTIGISDLCDNLSRIQELIIHELGHALGLFHPREFSYWARKEIDHNPWTLAKILLSDNQDKRQFSIMSRFGYDLYGMPNIRIHTPLLYDTVAIQYMYGTNYNYNKDNTIYQFPIENKVVLNIWDGGGIDTFNLSNFTRGVIIDLRSTHFSSIGWLPADDFRSSFERNEKDVSIAWDTVIENAIGGSGDDIIYNNEVSNIINGGDGEDRLIVDGEYNDYQFIIHNGNYYLINYHNLKDKDQISNIELIDFSDSTNLEFLDIPWTHVNSL